MKHLMWALAGLLLAPTAQSAAQAAQAAQAVPAPPVSMRSSGLAFLPPALQALQNDAASNPLTLWRERGAVLWQQGAPSCQSCHGAMSQLQAAAVHYPRLAADGRLRNLEDQIIACRARAGHPNEQLEDEAVLSLSAALHAAAQGQAIDVQPKAATQAAWQAHVERGAQRYITRQGRINLACLHCHDQRVGARLRADVISPAHPSGFPIYRMTWQTVGSIDRRLRACYSGVQAQVPAPGSAELRELELYLKVRAQGMPLDGPSLRR